MSSKLSLAGWWGFLYPGNPVQGFVLKPCAGMNGMSMSSPKAMICW